MELADVPDSKSGPGDRVRVRPPPPAPNKDYNFDTKVIVLFFIQKPWFIRLFYTFESGISVRIKIIRFLSTEFSRT